MPNASQPVLGIRQSDDSHLLWEDDKAAPRSTRSRRAMALSIDRQALDRDHRQVRRPRWRAAPAARWLWGMPADEVKLLPGYGPDVHKNRAEGRQIMQQAGYAPDKTLDIKVTTPQPADLSRSGRTAD